MALGGALGGKQGPMGSITYEFDVRNAPSFLSRRSGWPATTLSRMGLACVAALHLPVRYTVHELPATVDKPAVRYTVLDINVGPSWGTLTALDTRTHGKIRWQVKTSQPLIGGVLATAGDLVFTGEGDGNFVAFDSRTGARLAQFNCGAGVNAPPISFEIDGTQYIAVAAGGNQLFGFRQGDALLAFALPKQP